MVKIGREKKGRDEQGDDFSKKTQLNWRPWTWEYRDNIAPYRTIYCTSDMFFVTKYSVYSTGNNNDSFKNRERILGGHRRVPPPTPHPYRITNKNEFRISVASISPKPFPDFSFLTLCTGTWVPTSEKRPLFYSLFVYSVANFWPYKWHGQTSRPSQFSISSRGPFCVKLWDERWASSASTWLSLSSILWSLLLKKRNPLSSLPLRRQGTSCHWQSASSSSSCYWQSPAQAAPLKGTFLRRWVISITLPPPPTRTLSSTDTKRRADWSRAQSGRGRRWATRTWWSWRAPTSTWATTARCTRSRGGRTRTGSSRWPRTFRPLLRRQKFGRISSQNCHRHRCNRTGKQGEGPFELCECDISS